MSITHRRRFSPHTLAQLHFPSNMLNALLDNEIGELMEYRHLLKNPKYCKLYVNSYAK